MGGSSAPSVPKPPKLDKSYGQGVEVFLKYLPQLLGAEDKYRTTEDPKRIADQQALQDQFGPTQYRQQLDALNQLDPQFMGARNALGTAVTGDLASGTSLTPDQERVEEQRVRASQAARGNTYGGAPATAEAYALGDRGMQMYQQRLQNVGSFLSGPSAVDKVSQIAPVSPDRSYGYVNPNAGYLGTQFALQNYQNQVAASQLQASQSSSPWGSIGSIIGGVASIAGMFSDRRLKTDIKKVGKTNFGLNKYEFRYKSPKMSGVMADEVEKKMPSAVFTDPATGFKKVDYSKLGMRMEAA